MFKPRYPIMWSLSKLVRFEPKCITLGKIEPNLVDSKEIKRSLYFLWNEEGTLTSWSDITNEHSFVAQLMFIVIMEQFRAKLMKNLDDGGVVLLRVEGEVTLQELLEWAASS